MGSCSSLGHVEREARGGSQVQFGHAPVHSERSRPRRMRDAISSAMPSSTNEYGSPRTRDGK
eukprot:7447575-Prorocentrum_lima.AAC.1